MTGRSQPKNISESPKTSENQYLREMVGIFFSFEVAALTNWETVSHSFTTVQQLESILTAGNKLGVV